MNSENQPNQPPIGTGTTEGTDLTKIAPKRRPWLLEVGEQFMIRGDARRKAMSLLQVKLQVEKTEGGLIPKEYLETPEETLRRAEQCVLLRDIRKLYARMHAQVPAHKQREEAILRAREKYEKINDPKQWYPPEALKMFEKGGYPAKSSLANATVN